MSLFLVGMRGAGKSSAGRQAADQLDVEFADSDSIVEKRARTPIAQLFAEKQQALFRALERQVLQELLERHDLLVATGGGCVLEPRTRQALKRSGRAVWLSASPEILRRRLLDSERPSLTAHGLIEEVPILCLAREPLYRQCARHTIHTDYLSLQEVCNVIKHLWSFFPHDHVR